MDKELAQVYLDALLSKYPGVNYPWLKPGACN